jgi:putative membrane protein
MTDSSENPPPSVVGDDLGLGLQLPGTGTVDEAGRRRVHPITPLVHAVSALPAALLVLFTLTIGGTLAIGAWSLLVALALIVLLPAVVGGFAYLSWRNLWFWFDSDGDFRVDSGILTKKQRRLQLSRLQSVDVAQPLLARVFSLAELTVEVAGSHDSRVKVRYLSLADARALRNELLARAAGLRHDTAEAPETPIAFVTPRDLAVSLVLRSVTAALLGLTALIFVVTVLTSGWGGLVLALFTGGLPILMVVGEFMRYFNFTVSQSPDGLRTRFGLAKTETRTIPPGRVQAIEFVEPLLWRRWGWARVRVNIAGAGSSDSSGSTQETLLIPVATRAIADDIVARILPGLDIAAMDWTYAPGRSRGRSPIQWRNLAVAWDGAVLAARRGRVTRRLMVIPHVRTQSVRLTQGPWERAFELASIHVDTTPGPVKVVALHLDASFARSVVDAQASRAEQGRAADRTTRWAAPQPGSLPAES